MDVNADAGSLTPSGVAATIASKLAPTTGSIVRKCGDFPGALQNSPRRSDKCLILMYLLSHEALAVVALFVSFSVEFEA